MIKIIKWMWQCIDVIITVILASMIVLVFTNVVLRYGFSSGLRASVELSRLCLVWIVLLGAAVVLRRGEHLAIAEFSERFFPSAVPILNRLIWIVILISSGMLFFGAINQTMANWNNISPLTGLPTALFALAGVISGLLIALISLVRIFNPHWLMDMEDQE
ncbi:2,3-diketo-L-gulonate TRAP transporter small permease protein YiaM [Marinomonas spartinae]|uniref:TRAP transporter small permease protein n=1 Tax=Marinomonas spartinae TaxID=1792290 RepID=A0A1A8TP90_9GAMM|nr:TRAP transporter small permease [Marinomonas spartinae]SBS35110.1 2,3-diketo-L-gulonate TRAP transporter small permease protein YiaM [Marinomonas spartinae]SBS38403.1 2,3-diketo-L-gulonate TRAP transporter small permease protein YiaM [Marinomonas spartinae]